MGQLVAFPSDREDDDVANALCELEDLLDSAPKLLHRSADLTCGKACPAVELLRPIIRKLKSSASLLFAGMISGSVVLLFAGPDPTDALFRFF